MEISKGEPANPISETKSNLTVMGHGIQRPCEISDHAIVVPVLAHLYDSNVEVDAWDMSV